jgi:hypothetical protein
VINNAFGAVTSVTEPSLPHWVLNGIATCHAVSKFGDSFVGNQVEVRLGWFKGHSLSSFGPKDSVDASQTWLPDECFVRCTVGDVITISGPA